MREEIYDKMKELSADDICWIVRNITYYLVSYWNENDKGPIFDGSYDQTQIEQATRLQQSIRNKVDILGQVLEHRNFDSEYFEDLLTDNYYSKIKSVEKERDEFKEKARLFDVYMENEEDSNK